MRKVVLYGFVLFALALLVSQVTPLEFKTLNPGSTSTTTASTKPSQVEVTNFPAVQPVNGAVNVGNLPAVQSVAGTVSIGNLPLDGNGHLLVAVQGGGSNALVLHSTTATYQGDLGGRTGATQKCRAEFPNSHFVATAEINNALGSAGSGVVRGVVWLSSGTSASWVDDPTNLVTYTCNQWGSTSGQGIILGARGDTSGSGNIFGISAGCDSMLPILCAE
jgi:hypothetical protein